MFNPWVRRSPGEGHGNLLPYSCPENPMDRGAWQAIVRGVTKNQYNLVTKKTKQQMPILCGAEYIFTLFKISILTYWSSAGIHSQLFS